MKKHITPQSKCSEIKMLINKKKFKEKVFILLEGKTDIKLFRKLFDVTKVQLESLDGKGNVEHVVKSVLANNKNRIIGVGDADFDHVSNVSPHASIYLTDTHDTETLIIKGVGIDSIIAEYATTDYHDGLSRNLFKLSFQIAYEIGLLKLVNCIHGYRLRFKYIDFKEFINIKGLVVNFDQEKFVDQVIHRSNGVDSDIREELIQKVEDCRKNNHCQYMICSGHDLSQVISMIMSQKELSIVSPLSQSDIESTLRVSYGFNDFSKTNLFQNLSDWSLTYETPLFATQ